MKLTYKCPNSMMLKLVLLLGLSKCQSDKLCLIGHDKVHKQLLLVSQGHKKLADRAVLYTSSQLFVNSTSILAIS